MDNFVVNDVPEFRDSIPFEFPGEIFVNFDEVSPDEICISTFHNEPVWRCATLVAPAPAPDLFAHIDQPVEYIVQPQVFESKMSDESAGLKAPPLPVLLVPTHFESNLSFAALVVEVNRLLKSIVGLSFEYNNIKWECVYAFGPAHCKFELNIYQGFSCGHVVEGNRLSGDAMLFRSAYNQIRQELQSNASCAGSSTYDPYAVFTPVLMPPSIIPDCSDAGGLGPLLRMAHCPFFEAQEEASRTFCDLSAEEGMRMPLCENEGLWALRNLLLSDSLWANHHAAIALANICEEDACLELVLRAEILPVLGTLGLGMGYEFAEIRILAMHVLAKVTTRLAAEAVARVGEVVLRTWLSSATVKIENDGCDRLKLHTDRVLQNIMALGV